MKYIWIFITILGLIYICVTYISPNFTVKNSNKEIKLPTEILENGDLICRYGTGLWSDWFRKMGSADKRFSHIGIIIKKENHFSVIHACGNDLTGQGSVQQINLDSFLSEAYRIGIFRLSNIQSDAFVNTAITKVGTPFDWSFDADDDTALYCTELIQYSLQKSNPKIQIKTQNLIGKEFITIDACISQNYATEIFDSALSKK